MTKKEFLKTYGGKAVWCKTEELANEFLELADKFKCIWHSSGYKTTNFNCWCSYKEDTCYEIHKENKIGYCGINYFKNNNYKIIEFKSLKTKSTPQVTFDPPKTILTLNGREFLSISKDEPFDKEKGVLMCLAKANGFDYDKVSELVASAKKQMPKLTEAERVILENLPKEWKWIVRNEDDCIYLYKNKPYKEPYEWQNMDSTLQQINIFNHLFQFIKWSNKEPYEIEKLLEKGGEK